MNRDDVLKLLGITVIAFLVLNVVLFALKIITTLLFWVIIILGAVFAYKLLPKLKKKV